MLLSEILSSLSEDSFTQLVRSISLGKLRTYQLYEPFKTRAHLAKLNTESLRKAIPRFRARLEAHEEDFAKELAQAVLMSYLDMIRAVLGLLEIPNEDGFFAKDTDASKYLTEEWQERVWEKFRATYPEPALLLYINHLAWEFDKSATLFAPPA
jgi:hypothetical protein